ncbi:MAG: hypothetical protein U0768_03675 [Anaerolineae bacterium]
MSFFSPRRAVVALALGFVAAVIALVGVYAQGTGSCSMEGYVLDPQGRGVPLADVILKVSGRDGDIRVQSDFFGHYQIELPLLIVQQTGYMYARLASGDVIMIGAINFKRCRDRRDVFTNQPSGAGYTPGPTPAVPPPIPPAYPAPDAPLPSLANALAFFDLTALSRGGVSPGESFSLPICIAAFTNSVPQVSKLTFIAEFDPAKVRIRRITRLPSDPFTGQPQVSYGISPEPIGGRIRGRIYYVVDSTSLVELPALPRCTRLAAVEMEAITETNQPGDTLGFSTVKAALPDSFNPVNTSMRIGGIEGPIARTTTYVDVLTPEESRDILRRAYLPLLQVSGNLQPIPSSP